MSMMDTFFHFDHAYFHRASAFSKVLQISNVMVNE